MDRIFRFGVAFTLVHLALQCPCLILFADPSIVKLLLDVTSNNILDSLHAIGFDKFFLKACMVVKTIEMAVDGFSDVFGTLCIGFMGCFFHMDYLP